LLAMVVNDNAVNLTPTCALRFIASKLAPTSNEYADTSQQRHLPSRPAPTVEQQKQSL